MNDDCYCDIGEGEPWSWYAVEIRTSRKTRKCCECLDVIKIGEKYERIVGYLDELQVFVTCLFCAAEYARLASEADYCVPKGGLACALHAEIHGEL